MPKTVIKLTDEIYRKGEKEKNSAQMLKAYMWRMKYQEIVTPDSFYVGLTGLEQWAKQTKQPMDRAILHSLIAGIYADYAANNQWELRRRTEIVEEAPSADLREWTANIFVEKVRTNVKEALADSVLLLKTSSRDYIPFVELGETSEYYHHDMYHLLASRGIESLNRIERLSSGTLPGRYFFGSGKTGYYIYLWKYDFRLSGSRSERRIRVGTAQLFAVATHGGSGVPFLPG